MFLENNGVLQSGFMVTEHMLWPVPIDEEANGM